MKEFTIGDNNAAAPNLVRLGVETFDSVVVTNLGDDPLDLFTDGLNQVPSVTLNAGDETTVSGPVLAQSQGVSAFTLSGGVYGP